MPIIFLSQCYRNVFPKHLNQGFGTALGLLATRQLMLYLLAALSVVMFLAGCARDTSQLLAEAKQYQTKGDHRAAVVQIKNLLQQQPNNGEARYLLGLSSLALGELPSAEKEFKRAEEL